MRKIINIVLILLFLFPNPLYGQEPAEAAKTISLDFKGMDVVDVLKLLAQRGNMNIAISKNVRGKVTMFLKDVNVYDAFQIILASNQLAYEETANILNVMTDKEYEKLYHCFGGAISNFHLLHKARFSLPATGARELKVWVHQITPEWASVGLPTSVRVKRESELHWLPLELSDGQVLVDFNGQACQLEISLVDPSTA